MCYKISGHTVCTEAQFLSSLQHIFCKSEIQKKMNPTLLFINIIKLNSLLFLFLWFWVERSNYRNCWSYLKSHFNVGSPGQCRLGKKYVSMNDLFTFKRSTKKVRNSKRLWLRLAIYITNIYIAIIELCIVTKFVDALWHHTLAVGDVAGVAWLVTC